MKRIITFLFAIFMCATIVAQPLRDVVYLRNGSIIKGLVIEMVPNATISIRTADGSIFVYPASEVVRVEKEQRYHHSLMTSYAACDTCRATTHHRGYMGSIEGGICAYINESELRGSFLTTHGAQVTPKLFIGAGLGFDSGYGVIYADIRHFFNTAKTHCNPYLECKAGYGWSDNNYDLVCFPYDDVEIDDGFSGTYLSPSLGLEFPFGRHRAAVLGSLAYSAFVSSDHWYHSIGLRIGIAF